MENGLLMLDANALYEGFQASKKNSGWKQSVQRYELKLLSNIYDLQIELYNKTYVTTKGTTFTQRERGRERLIHGNNIKDRIVRHVLCDKIINPTINKYLIYDNGASLKGKGVSFSRERFEKHIHNFCAKTGSNEGYILFGDFSKFYDNILHKQLLDIYRPLVDDYTMWLIEVCLKDSRIDVSYMSNEEFENALFEKFNSIDYYKNHPSEQIGEKFLCKSMNIGDQLSQSSGVFYPTRIDNYVKIVRGIKYYGRYMDDFYIISKSKEELWDVLAGIKEEANKLGIFINDKKTHIKKLSNSFTYLQLRYFVTPSGHINKKINPKTISRERRKLKKYKKKMDDGIMKYIDIENSYKSWMGNYAKLMSKKQINSMKQLFKLLFGKEPTWKIEYTQSHLQMESPLKD